MEAGGYGYAHSAVVSENFPVPRTGGRRELGLDGFDDVWRPGARFAFVLPASPPRPTA